MRAPRYIVPAALVASASVIALGGTEARAAETYAAADLRLERVVAVLEIETGDFDQITVEYDPGEGVIDAPTFAVDGSALEIAQLPRRTNVSCRGGGDDSPPRVKVGRGDYRPLESYGRLVIRAPATATVDIGGGAVWGTIGDIAELDLAVNSCGDLTIGDVALDVDIAINGSGDVDLGTVGGELEIAVNGSGDIKTGAVAQGLDVAINGSGDVEVASIEGDIDAAINGSGDVRVLGGHAGSIDASIMGSGDVRFGGVAGQVDLSAFGSGDVYVAEVTGGVSTSAFGSGRIHVGAQQ